MAELVEPQVSRYQEYKPTGVEWMPEIPTGWVVKRLKHVADINVDALPETTDEAYSFRYLDIGNVTLGSINYNVEPVLFKEAPSRARRIVKKGDILVSTVRTYLKAIAQVEEDATNLIVSTGFAVVSAHQVLNQRFLFYLSVSEKFVDTISAYSTGVSYPAITATELGNMPVWFPESVEEQRAIAFFLDDKTAQLDQLITQKQQMLELLREERAALINYAVTKGLDPQAPLRDSGVEWLGEVPAHWEVKRLKHLLVGLEQGWSPSCESREAEPGEWGVLKVGCVNGLHFNASENKALPSELAPMPEYEISKGDFLISRANTKELVGSASIVGEVRPKLLLCDKLFRLFFKSVANKEFLFLIISSGYGRFQIQSECSGASSSMQNISQEFLKNMMILLPNQWEQQAIVEYVEEQTSRILDVTDTINQEIALLQEYRAALIAEAVTGQLDVRHYAPAAAAALQ